MAGVDIAVTPALPAPPPPEQALLLPQPILPDLLPKKDPLAAILAAAPKSEAYLKQEAAAAPLVIHLPDVQGVSNLPNTVNGNTYSPPLGYSAASAQATASATDGQRSECSLTGLHPLASLETKIVQIYLLLYCLQESVPGHVFSSRQEHKQQEELSMDGPAAHDAQPQSPTPLVSFN